MLLHPVKSGNYSVKFGCFHIWVFFWLSEVLKQLWTLRFYKLILASILGCKAKLKLYKASTLIMIFEFKNAQAWLFLCILLFYILIND
jgi:hypothetical protein